MRFLCTLSRPSIQIPSMIHEIHDVLAQVMMRDDWVKATIAVGQEAAGFDIARLFGRRWSASLPGLIHHRVSWNARLRRIFSSGPQWKCCERRLPMASRVTKRIQRMESCSKNHRSCPMGRIARSTPNRRPRGRGSLARLSRPDVPEQSRHTEVAQGVLHGPCEEQCRRFEGWSPAVGI